MSSDLYTNQRWQRKVSRRAMLRGTGLALGMAVVGANVTGCRGNTPQAQTQSQVQTQPQALTTATVRGTERKRGGTFVTYYGAQVGTLNPHTGYAEINRYVHGRLLEYDYVNGELQLELAESLETPDPLTYIFKIRPTAKFQQIAPVNGRAVTSQDIVTSWNAYRDNPRTVSKQILTEFVDHYEMPNDSTLVVKMKKPNAWALGPEGFAQSTSAQIVPAELFDQNLLDKVAIGCGGYVLEQYDPQSIVSFKRRPDGWYTPERPYLDRVVFLIITDTTAAMAALKAKQIDFMYPRDKLAAQEIRGYGSNIISGLWYNGFPRMLYLRADKEGGLFYDERVRQAIYTGLNIQELINNVDLGDGVFTGPVPVNLEAYKLPEEEIKKQWPFDLAKAKQLLAAGGWDPNTEVPFKYGTGATMDLIAAELQKQFAAIGIKIKLVPQDPYTVWLPETFYKKDFQMTGGSLAYYATPDTWLRIWTTQGTGAGSFARWSDPEIDAIVAKQQLEFDTEKQKALIMEAQRMIFRKYAPIMNLWTQKIYATWWDYYYPVLATMGYWGYYGHFEWIDAASPVYPKEERNKKFPPLS